jgi:acetyltransferase-like isoleucine patch superfamily enzyme
MIMTIAGAGCAIAPAALGPVVGGPLMIIIAAVFIVLIAAPFFLGIAEHFKPRDGFPSRIDNTYVRDGRYFDKSFAALLRNALGDDPAAGLHTVKLSRKETVEVKKETVNTVTGVVPHILVVCGTLETNRGSMFKKEVWVQGNALLGSGTAVRALYSGGSITLEDQVRVSRWMTAEGTIRAGNHTDLGMRLVAEKRVDLGSKCRFKYLYGMPVAVAAVSGRQDETPPPVPSGGEIASAAIYVANNALSLPPGTVMEKDAVVYGTVHIREGSSITGSIKAYDDIVIADNVTVVGNLFSEKNIVIGRNCRIRGNIFSQGNVVIHEGAEIGLPDAAKTVFGRQRVLLHGGVLVYGYTLSTGTGMTV